MRNESAMAARFQNSRNDTKRINNNGTNATIAIAATSLPSNTRERLVQLALVCLSSGISRQLASLPLGIGSTKLRTNAFEALRQFFFESTIGGVVVRTVDAEVILSGNGA